MKASERTGKRGGLFGQIARPTKARLARTCFRCRPGRTGPREARDRCPGAKRTAGNSGRLETNGRCRGSERIVDEELAGGDVTVVE